MRSVILTFLIVISFGSEAQDDTLSIIVRNLDGYTQKFPQEKVFLHTDRDFYSPGQMVWFKSYVVNAATLQPMNLSTVLYVELINDEHSVILKRNVFVDEGFGTGNILLPDSITAGSYLMRAYTKYMLNYSPDYLFRKSITVVSQDSDEMKRMEYSAVKIDTLPRIIPRIDLQFFPEGGHMVAGQLSVLGFKAIATDGLGAFVKGRIFDSSNQPVADFSSNSVGMGKVTIVPQEGESYYATSDQTGTDQYALPDIKSSGFILKARIHNGYLNIQAQHNQGSSLAKYAIILHSRGITQAYLPGRDAYPFIVGKLNLDQFPDGILTITLVDPGGVALCERLIFVDSGNANDLTIKTDKIQYDPREKIDLSISLKDNDSAQVSLSAVRPEYLSQGGKSVSIVDYLLLESDLRGYIENISRYSNPDNPSKSEDMDALMLTQGWRKFNWFTAVSGRDPEIFYKPEQGFSVVGQVKKYYNESEPVQSNVTLSFMEDFLSRTEYETGKDGYFIFNQLQFIDTVQAVIQAEKLNKKKRRSDKKDPVKVEIIKDPPPAAFGTDSLTIMVNRSLKNRDYQELMEKIAKIDSSYFLNDPETILLEEVSITATREEWKDSPYNRGQLYRNPRSRLFIDSLGIGNVFSIIDMFRRLPGVQVGGIFPDYSIRVRNSVSIQLDTSPLILVDNIPTELQFIVGMDGSMVEYIDLLSISQAALYGDQAYGGVIAIYTRKGFGGVNAQQDKLSWGINSFELVGFQSPDQYYAPRYEVEKPEHIRPDYRSVLHWEPTIVVREGEETAFDFYASDENAEYLILLQGMTYNGVPIRETKMITVRRDSN